MRMTIELIRKRSEHNEGEIYSLEELSLHQEKLDKIENLDKWCRGLRVLLLQNNNINKIENLYRLKCLEYVNLALNNIEVIEGLEGCESLKKLDLTLNFIGQISCITHLRQNYFLEQLYLSGNPCTDFSGYRNYVIATLPQIKVLDGNEIMKSERIKAKQVLANVEECIHVFEKNKKDERDMQRNMPENEDIESDEFWSRPSANTPEARAQIQRRMELDEEKKSEKRLGTIQKQEESKIRKYFAEDGRPFNINEAKHSFSLHDDCKNGVLVVELDLPRYLDTSLVNADVQPNYVRVLVKNKIFQLCLPEEVRPDSSIAQRSKINGHLMITMPKLDKSSIIEIWTTSKSESVTQNSKAAKLGLDSEPEIAIIKDIVKERIKLRASGVFNDDCVPPLI